MGKSIRYREVWKLLMKSVDRIQNFHDRRVPMNMRSKVTLSQFKVMGCILFSPGQSVTITEIARELNITPGGVSQIVDKLVRDGVAERTHSEVDRRTVNVTVSKRGREFGEQLDVFFEDLMAQLLSAVSREKQLIFYEVLKELDTAIENMRESHRSDHE